jgi:4-hydroxy-3-methylbut-2-en-1-yl diphosphate synthase IspG/GcpE
MGNLLWAGIGDTIRVSLSAEPEQEVRVGFEILKALGLRTRGVRIVSCPIAGAAGSMRRGMPGPWRACWRRRRSFRPAMAW